MAVELWNDVEIYNAGGKSTLSAQLLTGDQTHDLPDQSGTIALTSDIGGSESLAATLLVGNTSGGTNILMSGLDKIEFTDATNYLQKTAGEMLLQTTKGLEVVGPDTIMGTGSPDGIQISDLTGSRSFSLDPIGGELILKQSVSITNDLVFDATTASRIWTLPDNTGTIALLSDITGTETLAATLVAGRTTGGTNIEVDNGDSIFFGPTGGNNTITEGGANRLAFNSDSGHFFTTGDWAILFAASNGNFNVGSTTDGNKGIQIIPNSGYIEVKNPSNGFPATMAFSNHTAAQTYDFPDASGFVALSNDPSNEVTFAVAAASRVVNHNKARRVTWTCYDASGNWIQPGTVTDDGNTLTLNFAPNQAGSVVYF